MLGGAVLVIVHTCDLCCVMLVMLKAKDLGIWSLVLPPCQFDEYCKHLSYRRFLFRKPVVIIVTLYYCLIPEAHCIQIFSHLFSCHIKQVSKCIHDVFL